MDKERWKWIVTGLLILLALSVAFLVVGAQSGVDWGTVLGLVSPAGIVLLLLLGGLYQMGEALTCRTVLLEHVPPKCLLSFLICSFALSDFFVSNVFTYSN